MIKPLHPFEIFLLPGDYCFASQDTRISTVLGSCIAITFWHPQLLLGGMCHYMLPGPDRKHRVGNRPVPNGRYADQAIALMVEEMNFIDTPYEEYQVMLFGGGNMFPGTNSQLGDENIEAAQRLVKKYGFNCVAEHTGDTGHRHLIFEVWSGEVSVKYTPISSIDEPDPLHIRRKKWLG